MSEDQREELRRKDCERKSLQQQKMNDDQREEHRRKACERKRVQMQEMNEDERNAHRCQNRDQVRAHRKKHWEGVIDAMTQTEPISITMNNHPNHEGVMNVGDGLHTKSNVSVVSHEDEVAIHKFFCE